MMNHGFRVSYKRVPPVLVAVALVLCVLSVLFNAYEWHLGVDNTYWVMQLTEFFSVTHEANLPTWFSSFLLLAAASLGGIVALAGQHQRRRWAAFSLLLLYLAIDEAAVIHEMFTTPIREAFQLGGHLYFSWVIVGVPAALLVGLLFIPFLLRLPAHTRNTMFVAGMVYLSGAVLVESIAANQWATDGGTSLLYAAISSVEEFLEMLGAIIVIYGLLRYLTFNIETVTITFGTEEK